MLNKQQKWHVSKMSHHKKLYTTKKIKANFLFGVSNVCTNKR